MEAELSVDGVMMRPAEVDQITCCPPLLRGHAGIVSRPAGTGSSNMCNSTDSFGPVILVLSFNYEFDSALRVGTAIAASSNQNLLLSVRNCVSETRHTVSL